MKSGAVGITHADILCHQGWNVYKHRHGWQIQRNELGFDQHTDTALGFTPDIKAQCGADQDFQNLQEVSGIPKLSERPTLWWTQRYLGLGCGQAVAPVAGRPASLCFEIFHLKLP